jgi:hypothetical protein
MTDVDRLDDLAQTAKGESVTTEALQREIDDRPLYRLLDDSEQPHFLLHGTVLDIVDESVPESASGRRSRKVASSGTSLSTVVTDRRVAVFIPRTDDIERLNIPFEDVTAVKAETAPGGNHRLSVQAGNNSYRIDTSRTEREETNSASEYADHAEPTSERTDTPDTGASDGVTDSLDDLERLADLYERGILTEQEFEEMKAEILE